MDNVPHTPVTRSFVRSCVLFALLLRFKDYKTFPEYEIEHAVNETIRRVEKKGYLVVGEEVNNNG